MNEPFQSSQQEACLSEQSITLTFSALYGAFPMYNEYFTCILFKQFTLLHNERE